MLLTTTQYIYHVFSRMPFLIVLLWSAQWEPNYTVTPVSSGGNLDALNFRCAQHDFLSERSLEEKRMPADQWSLRDIPRSSARFHFTFSRVKGSGE